MKKKKSSSIWLIILLCAIIVALVWLMNSVKYQNTVGQLTGEIQRLNQELENQEKMKNVEIEQLKESLSKSLASPSATPSSSPEHDSLAQPELKIATYSGEKG